MKLKLGKKGAPRKERKPRRKTAREKQMWLNKKRVQHETRKKKKQKGPGQLSRALKDYTPNITAMFRRSKKEKNK